MSPSPPKEVSMSTIRGPIAGRLKRPGWTDPRLLIGVLLIAVSVTATATIVSRADRTEPYLVARGTLTPGTVLSESTVVVAHVRVGDGYVLEDDAPWGSIVTRVVKPGELIPESALAEPGVYDSRPVAVSSALPLAEGIEPGAIVDVWLTREGLGGQESVLVASGLVVDQVDHGSGAFSGSAAEVVYVLVPADDVGDFLAALADDGEVAIVGLGGNGSS
jgi:hypothetical protein